MTKSHTHYLLRRDGSATPVLDVCQSELHPARFVAASPESVLIGSGFSELQADCSYPLSAALQLNGDLTDMAPAQLSLSGQAELEQKRSARYRSYTVEPDSRLCVLADSARKLSSFIDTYGGLLEIEPLLLTGSHPDFPPVIDLQAVALKDGYRLIYSIRSPVDENRCTYCGACGSACPEACISERLFFDFERCTSCRNCEKACLQQAIDIHAIEQLMLQTPAILLLGRARLDLPQHGKRLLRESDLPYFLSTLFPCQVEEVVTCNQSLCHYSTRSTSGCTACIAACSAQAITAADNGICIDPMACTDCGHCIGTCPTGALQYERFNDTAFLEFFRTFPLPVKTTVVLGSETELHQLWWRQQERCFPGYFFMQYPTSGALSLMHGLFLLAHGAEQIIVLRPEGTEDGALKRRLAEINTLIALLFGGSERIYCAAVADFPPAALSETEAVLTEPVYSDLSYSNKREKISSILKHLVTHSSKSAQFTSRQISGFSTIHCRQDACTQCFACLNECRIQALAAEPSAMSLCWTGALCIGCGACVSICPEQALHLDENVTLSRDFFSPAELARTEPMHCRECGKVFGTRKSYERVMGLLAQHNFESRGHYEYCERCRVLKLFTASEIS